MLHYAQKSIPLLLIAALAGCGGGGSDGGTTTPPPQTKPVDPVTPPPGTTPDNPPPTTTPGTAPLPGAVPASASMLMSCVDGPTFQCSGGSIRTDNGVTLTSSGVQVYGRSTADLVAQGRVNTTTSGLGLATGGLAELRMDKAANGSASAAALMLSNLGLSWDGNAERPLIIETFNPTQGRTVLTSTGTISSVALQPSSNLNFYDYAVRGAAGTQANYANNRYFPRTEPSRCDATTPPTTPPTSCPTTETAGLRFQAGDWRTGGSLPDNVSASRLHADGDVHAGNDTPGPNGEVRILPGGTGVGVPAPGAKGFRAFDNWGLQYANLSLWTTQDTVQIAEWSGSGADEHNKNRRGVVAYGDVTNPAAVPTSGTASYAGTLFGWYSANGTGDPTPFRGAATMTVNFATRQVTVTTRDAIAFDATATPIPVAFTAAAGMGAAGATVANYLTGTVDAGALKGGVSARYFGPVVTTGTSGAGPAEVAGAFSLSGATTGGAVVGGFIGRKQ